MSYSRNRQAFQKDLLAGSVRTNGLILMSLWLPAGKTYVIYNLYCFMSTGGTVATTVTLTQDGGSTLATLITTALAYAKWDATGPLTITPAAAGSKLQLTQNVTDVLGVGSLFLDMDMPFPV